MNNKLTVYDTFYPNCYNHPQEKLPENIRTIIALGGCYCKGMNDTYDTCESYCDSSSFGFGIMEDGRYIVCRESSDTSGHGCRCDGDFSIHETFRDAYLLGLTNDERLEIQKYLSRNDSGV